jgi:hypothetical protein
MVGPNRFYFPEIEKSKANSQAGLGDGDSIQFLLARRVQDDGAQREWARRSGGVIHR